MTHSIRYKVFLLGAISLLAFGLRLPVTAQDYDQAKPAPSEAKDFSSRTQAHLPTSYTIGSGNDQGTLSGVARLFYGEPRRWITIYEHNRNVITNPDLIHNGMQITIPKLETLTITGELVSVWYNPRLHVREIHEEYQVKDGPHDGAVFTFLYRWGGPPSSFTVNSGLHSEIVQRVSRNIMHEHREQGDRQQDSNHASMVSQPGISMTGSLFIGNIQAGVPDLPIPHAVRLPEAIRNSIRMANRADNTFRTIRMTKSVDNVWVVVAVEDHTQEKEETAEQNAAHVFQKPREVSENGER